MSKLWAIVLAAGEGKRMHSSLPKVLHPVCGKPMLEYVLDAAASVSEHLITVVGRDSGLIEKTIGPRCRYARQETPLGTGHAVMQALDLLPEEGNVLVLCGDTPLFQAEDLERLISDHGKNAATVATAVLNDPTGYGRVIRDRAGRVCRIVEHRDASPEEKKVKEINTGTYCFDIRLLKRHLPRLSSENSQGEYFLTDVVGLIQEDGYPVGGSVIDDPRIGLGINDRVQLSEAASIRRAMINSELMRQGVTIIDPGSTYIDHSVEIGSDTVIWPNSVIEGCSRIGTSCRIGPGAHLKNVEIDDHVELRYSVVEESVVKSSAVIGPFAYIRPGCLIGSKVKIGDFVEVKNAAVGMGTKIPHLSYVGDADIGEGANLGAGVIIVNYDGRRKHRSQIGKGAFIGCNSNLVSPLEIGENAFVAAGSTVTDNVPPGALALARAQQENRPGLGSRLLKKNLPRQELPNRNEKK